MKREQQKKLRELKNTLPKIIQSEIKKYKLKKKDFMVWVQKKELFFDLMIYICERDGRCYCASTERLKPMWLDDLLWDILEMPENKSEPVSLRAIGAFTVYGSEIYESETELLNWELEELRQCVVQYMEHFYQNTQSCEIGTFYEYMCKTLYHQELRRGLTYIHDGEYEKAIEYLSICDKGNLCNKGIWVNDAMRDYCKNRINIR